MADALSRAPVSKGESGLADDVEAYVNIVTIARMPVSDVLFGEIRTATLEDQQLSVLLSHLQSSWSKVRKKVREDIRQFCMGHSAQA